MALDRQSSRLKVMQLNAENLFLFLDDQPPAHWRTMKESEWQNLSKASVQNKSLKKTLGLSAAILDVKPHVVALNEVGGAESLSNFNRLFLDGLYEEHLVEGNSDRGIDVGYLVLKSWNKNFQFVSYKERPINFLYPHEREGKHTRLSHLFSRDCAELRIFPNQGPGDSGPAPDPEFILFLVHLKSKLDPDGIDPYGNMRRGAEARTLVEIYNESLERFPQTHHMVIGDFNGIAREDGHEPEFDVIYESTDLKNALEIAGLEKDFSTTQVQFLRQGGRVLLQFDYIFVGSSLSRRIVSEETFVYRYKNDMGIHSLLPSSLDQKLALPSDHYPVVVTFEI